jgi:hypothetical protein
MTSQPGAESFVGRHHFVLLFGILAAFYVLAPVLDQLREGLNSAVAPVVEGILFLALLSGLPAHTVGFQLSGKLHDEDYKTFVPLVDAAIAQGGKARLLAQLHDFGGWDLKALGNDIKFSTRHCPTIERVALVGDKAWEKWMAQVCKPFTMAKIRYFGATDLEAAKVWLAEA